MPRTRSTTPGPGGLGLPLTYTRNTMDAALPGNMTDEEAETIIAQLRFRWTPLLAGVLIPFSILLEIPGTTEKWYVRTSGNDVVEYRDNPIILNAGLALSMASAVLANISLIARFLEWRITLVTMLCISCLTFHG